MFLQTTFLAMVQKCGGAWLALDALDECVSRGELLSWLGNLRNTEINLHLIAASRPEYDVRDTMELIYDDENQRVAIRGELLEADIRSYVHATIREQKGFGRWKGRSDIQEEIETSLVSKANRM
jgi:hypothetical protein